MLVASVHANSRPVGSSGNSGADFSVALLPFRLFRRQASDRGHDRLLLLSCVCSKGKEKRVRCVSKKKKQFFLAVKKRVDKPPSSSPLLELRF